MKMVTGAIMLLAGIIMIVGSELSGAAWATFASTAQHHVDVGRLGWHYADLPYTLFICGAFVALFGVILIIWGLVQDAKLHSEPLQLVEARK